MYSNLESSECCTEETKHHTDSTDFGIITVNFGHGPFWSFGKVTYNMCYCYYIFRKRK